MPTWNDWWKVKIKWVDFPFWQYREGKHSEEKKKTLQTWHECTTCTQEKQENQLESFNFHNTAVVQRTRRALSHSVMLFFPSSVNERVSRALLIDFDWCGVDGVCKHNSGKEPESSSLLLLLVILSSVFQAFFHLRSALLFGARSERVNHVVHEEDYWDVWHNFPFLLWIFRIFSRRYAALKSWPMPIMRIRRSRKK